jgi:hypothetical protein
MDDYTGALFDHPGQQRPIEPDGREEVLVERLVPFVVVEDGKATGRRGRATDDVNEDIHAAKMFIYGVGDTGAAFGC